MSFSSLNMGQCQKFKVPLTVLQDVGRLKFEKVFYPEKLSLFNCSLSTFQGEVSFKPDLAWEYDAGREGLHVTAALGSLCLGREWGRRISHIVGALQLLLSERLPLGTTSGFRLGQQGSPPPFPALLPWASGTASGVAHCSWLDVWESSEHSPSRLRNSADLYDNKSNG